MSITDSREDLLDFIKGSGKYSAFGEGIVTYPQSVDSGQMKLHAECLILENEGKIHRHFVLSERYIVWMPKDENSPDL